MDCVGGCFGDFVGGEAAVETAGDGVERHCGRERDDRELARSRGYI